MSYTRVTESRAYDYMYDTTYTNPWSTPMDNAEKISASLKQQVSGTKRYKFFKRPVVPLLNAMPPEVLLAPTATEDPLLPPVLVEEPPTKTIEIQTDYRESEAQTDPYTPAYILKPNTIEPEVLSLEELTHKNGLPVGVEEVKMIEHARKRRLVEASLPPFTDEASMALRKKILEGQEMLEFKLREKEIDQRREARIKVLTQAIHERDRGNEYLHEQRVETLRQRKIAKRDEALAAIQSQRIKVLRKLTKKRAEVSLPGHSKGRDIISEYADYGSTVYAPIKREGRHPEKDGFKFEVERKTAPVGTLKSIQAIEASTPAYMFTTNLAKAAQSMVPKRTPEARRKEAIKGDLSLMNDIICSQKASLQDNNATGAGTIEKLKSSDIDKSANMESSTSPMPGWRTKKAVERPPTPTVPESVADEITEPYILLLQRLIRGRAMQNIMFEGKERRRALIRELRYSVETQAKPEEEERRELEARKERNRIAALDTVAGEAVSSLLDFLSKELVRKEQKDSIHSLALTADEKRRKLEVEEGGMRQGEELVRDRNDEVFEQVLRTHYGTSKSYIDEVIEQGIEKKVNQKAMEEMCLDQKLQKDILNAYNEVHDIDQSKNSEKEEIVKDLMSSFLYPSVDRIQVQSELEEEEKAFVDAAHKEINNSVKDTHNKP